MVNERETPPSRISSEGGGGGSMSTEELLPPSRVWSEGGGSDGVNEGTPPCLAFQAREGVVVVDGRETPPSRISSDGGGGGRRNYSLRLAFGAREG